jgi:hypothetical protein
MKTAIFPRRIISSRSSASDTAVQHSPGLGTPEDRVVQKMIGLFDAPAYVRRAGRVQQAYDDLVAICRRQREQWLGMVRIRLAVLRAMVGDWSALETFLAEAGQCRLLAELEGELCPQPLGHIERTTSPRLLRRGLQELCESLERFNRRWRPFLAELSLDAVNEERAAYNRHYLLEKECALRSAILARQGFQPLQPLTVQELAALMPELAVPQCKQI